MAYQQSELGEGDWLRIAEEAYKAYSEHLNYAHDCDPGEWDDMEEMDQEGWVAAVKATSEELSKTSLR